MIGEKMRSMLPEGVKMRFTGDCPVVPTLFARPTAVEVASGQRPSGPANGFRIEISVRQAEIDGGREFFFVEHFLAPKRF